MNQETILALVNRVVSDKDHVAFARLVSLHQSMIRHFLRRLTAGNHAQAEDLAQETFLQAYQKIHQYRSKGAFSSWLHTIAYRMFLKSIDNTRIVLFEPELHSECVDANHTMSASDADIYAEQLMALLSYKERVVITLSCAAGMSHSEIQSVTELPLGSIKSLILRAKNKIIKYAKQDLEPKQAQS